MNKIKEYILPVIAISIVYILLGIAFISTENSKRKYEQEYNCRYDYNDLCYTIEQKPHLFKQDI